MKQMQPLTESQLQIQIFEWAQLMTGKYPELYLLYHIPNEGKRSIYCGLYIELKVGKNKPTKNQEYWLFSLSKMGHRTAVCYTREQVQKEILSYLALKDTSE